MIGLLSGWRGPGRPASPAASEALVAEMQQQLREGVDTCSPGAGAAAAAAQRAGHLRVHRAPEDHRPLLPGACIRWVGTLAQLPLKRHRRDECLRWLSPHNSSIRAA